jgi:hypothetical protein
MLIYFRTAAEFGCEFLMEIQHVEMLCADVMAVF